MSLTPHNRTARMLTLVWGVHSVLSKEVERVSDVINDASQVALGHNFAQRGELLAITAGMPFGVSGTTNFLRIATVE